MASDLEQDTHATRRNEAGAMLAALNARERRELLRQLGKMIDSHRQIEVAP